MAPTDEPRNRPAVSTGPSPVASPRASPLVLHRSPDAGFDDPMAMLGACHERVQRMLRLLARLVAHLGTHGADAQAQAAAQDVLRYFDRAAPQHHEDEERHVLPRLRAAGEAALAARIASEHVCMATAWSGLRGPLGGIAAGAAPEARGLQAQAAAFAQLYLAHVRLEEELAYPLVLATLSPHALRLMGEEMAERRRRA